MERWTMEQMNSLTDLQFAWAILGERLNKLNPYSPLAAKLRSAMSTLHDTDLEKTLRQSQKGTAGVCPICGCGINYGEREQMDDGGVYHWECPGCGATGEEGFNEVFDGNHYNVRDKNGKLIHGQNY